MQMDNNQICAIQGSPFEEMPRLRFLGLKNNKMTTFPEPTFHRLRSNLAVLDVAGNPIACSCGVAWLQSWLQDASDGGPHCSDGSPLKDMRLSRQECQHARNVDSVAPGCEVEGAGGNAGNSPLPLPRLLQGNSTFTTLSSLHQSSHQNSKI